MLAGKELLRKRHSIEKQHKRTPDRDNYKSTIPFTCDQCFSNETCPSAFDAYNTNGDCLEEK